MLVSAHGKHWEEVGRIDDEIDLSSGSTRFQGSVSQCFIALIIYDFSYTLFLFVPALTEAVSESGTTWLRIEHVSRHTVAWGLM